jgi:hypothetical protein
VISSLIIFFARDRLTNRSKKSSYRIRVTWRRQEQTEKAGALPRPGPAIRKVFDAVRSVTYCSWVVALRCGRHLAGRAELRTIEGAKAGVVGKDALAGGAALTLVRRWQRGRRTRAERARSTSRPTQINGGFGVTTPSSPESRPTWVRSPDEPGYKQLTD